MDIIVDSTLSSGVEVGATGVRQLAQEVRTLLSTSRGSVPLDRDFGVSWELIDMTLPQAKQMLIAEVAQQIERYVPRVKFKGIAFPDTRPEAVDGRLAFKVTVTIREEYLDEFIES